MEITVDNVNQALSEGLQWLLTAGIEEPSRNGPVIVSPEPVMTTYRYPQERVLFSPERDANPFFHLFESLWMLAGRDDIAFPARFNKNYTGYSDDGETQHGAYGYRWRSHFGYDQLPIIIKELKANPATRRAVLQMWDAGQWSVEIDGYNPRLVGYDDLHYAMTPGTKDAPCNTHIYFDARGGYVNMTVLCRSNDIYWGAYGANAVHFSVLQEYVAEMAGYPVGVYRQFSNNFHLYTELYPNLKGRDAIERLASTAADFDYYAGILSPTPLVDDPETWDQDLMKFFCWIENGEGDVPNLQNKFFFETAVPMYCAWKERKANISTGLPMAKEISAPDWRRACCDWIERREAKKRRPHMPKANETQIAGDHYRTHGAEYQHWDLVADTGMGYFEGQITKYVTRWKKKNGKQDLEKSLHYAQKMQELIRQGRYPMRQVPQRDDAMVLVSNFAIAQKLLREETIIFELCACHATEADLERLIMHIGTLLEKSI